MFNKLSNNLKKERTFSFIWELLDQYPECEVFVVGGILRDEILHRKSKDFDFVVRNVDGVDLNKFLEKRGWVSLVGKNFGVYKFKPNNSKYREPFDIALPRTEFSTGVAYRDFEIQSDPSLDIEDDLSRRDFTINAMAYDLKKNKLIDPYNGVKDIERKIIDTVGKPQQRFSEDYSRILRAIRFSAQLDFEISRDTWDKIENLAPNIVIKRKIDGKLTQIIPSEIISAEFSKAFQTNPVTSFRLFDQSGLFKVLIPEIEAMKNIPQPEEYHKEGDVFVHTGLCMD
jgi:tRNA nucleotidyltransferase/poly(A) polymerase